ncbi:GbsR/MarR family transcriptional regulator [Virgibacillus oceani]|uniref:HTH-type transcriptional regulator n=1 Tax=Virgibacillus oceani TaxID=1479511 RepID=A0A917M4I7_9BACI|nr:transcriptional regulator [Virgibacillus oceani]GGG74932.1 HTH-type transcriptional repressor OpcR [Virgibacillus oceani]
MNEHQNETITNKIILEFAKTIEMFDLTPLEARLFAFLYLNEKAYTLDEMSEALGKSKTSMSTSVRSLVEFNLVTRVWKKGVRKDLYQANMQLFKSFMPTYINKWIDATNHQLDSLEEIENKLQQNEYEDNEKLTLLKKRLNNIIDFHHEVEQSFRDMKED